MEGAKGGCFLWGGSNKGYGPLQEMGEWGGMTGTKPGEVGRVFHSAQEERRTFDSEKYKQWCENLRDTFHTSIY